MNDAFLDAGGLTLHYLDHAGGEPPIVLLHGVSSNGHVFDAVAAAGLSPRHRLLAPDLRGRGLSGKPPAGYAMEDHARDVLALLDAHGLERAVICGHSFGGLLGLYLAARHAPRVARLVVIDAARQFHPRTAELLAPSLGRLDRTFPSWDAYLAVVQATPQFHGVPFDDALLAHYRADVEPLADGSVRPRAPSSAIEQAGRLAFTEPWKDIIAAVEQPVLLLNATGPYGLPGTPPLLPRELAEETVRELRRGRYAWVPGNHMTMMFGEGARVISDEVERFLRE